ncbi:hypothetical protein ANN_22173 [Periplaneta americana]|uniref:CFAP61 dimerisation domain-containing protein n=1 Tax=Periplaneta americana TaxID=6978 RepID=A0ABQ8S7D9_PERAM|nr:hypothetical protein ANN_22173 [Periplaneta americana]
MAALEKGQLVFDGRLVIDANFNAGDKYIYAAGPLTKYARRYYAGRYSHCYYNSIEIGAKLGKQMLQMWDPTVEASAANEEIPPLFEKPIIKSCILPGNMHYLKIHKPGIVVPLEAAMYQDDYGVALVTGDCKCIKYDYFRIHLNPSERIETITCYTKNVDSHCVVLPKCLQQGWAPRANSTLSLLFHPFLHHRAPHSVDAVMDEYKHPRLEYGIAPDALPYSKYRTSGMAIWQQSFYDLHLEIDVDNISTLYGVHQQMLNNMVLRFKHGYINDFYSYFREPWCYAIIHDHFKDLVLKNNKILSAESETKPAVLLDVVTKHLKLSNWKNPGHKLVIHQLMTWLEARENFELSRRQESFSSYFKKKLVANIEINWIMRQGLTELKNVPVYCAFASQVNHTELEEYKNCYKTQYEKMIKDALLEFLVDNSYHLSMYAIPERVKILLQDNKSSPLFMEPEPGTSSESLCSSDSNNSSSSTIKDEVDNENN